MLIVCPPLSMSLTFRRRPLQFTTPAPPQPKQASCESVAKRPRLSSTAREIAWKQSDRAKKDTAEHSESECVVVVGRGTIMSRGFRPRTENHHPGRARTAQLSPLHKAHSEIMASEQGITCIRGEGGGDDKIEKKSLHHRKIAMLCRNSYSLTLSGPLPASSSSSFPPLISCSTTHLGSNPIISRVPDTKGDSRE